MSAFDLTDADAAGLDALAASQLRLALRFAERAEAAEDDDAACRLARTSERAARSYRQILLVKSKLKRDRDTARREEARSPVPRTLQEQEQVDRRRRDLYRAAERLILETLDEEDLSEGLEMAYERAAAMAEEPGSADADLALQATRVLAFVQHQFEPWDAPGELDFERTGADTEPADSS
jgi:hypothetical protein